VLSHLINKINLHYENPLITITDPEVGVEVLQGLLVSSELTFLLDDCESNQDVSNCILPILKGKNTFIYASRNDVIFKPASVTCFPVDEFSAEESRDFLSKNGIEIDILSFNSLYEASKGNPLYLFYFSKFQLKPFPEDVHQFHQKIWQVLDAKQQECLIAVAMSYQHININSLSQLFDFKYLTETVKFVEDLTVLSKNSDGELSIFHPAFREFILEEVERNGSVNSYKVKFGEYFLGQNKLVQAAYLLMEVKPETLKEIGYEIAPIIVNSGDLEFANRLLLSMLKNKTSLLEEGYIKYHLSCNYRLQNNIPGSKSYLEDALTIFRKVRSRYWISVASMNLAMNMVEDGDHEQGLKLANDILEKSKKYGSEFKGQLLVNLSKIFVDLHEYEKSAAASKMAYEFFEKKNHVYGMISSLANLASSISKLDDYDDIGEKYALKLLSLSDTGISFHIELIALNILTSINRQNGQYQVARSYGLKAVQIAQKYRLENKALLNLINYGNVLRDDNDIDEAVKVYHEALVQATNLGLKKEQSRIYWILSAIHSDREEYAKSLEYIDLSILLAQEKTYNYGVAHGYEEKAKLLLKMGEKENAALAYFNSANTFKKIDNFLKSYRKSLSKAVILYYETGNEEMANSLLISTTDDISGGVPIYLQDVLEAHDSKIDIHSYFSRLCSSYIQIQSEHNLILEFLIYLEYCLKNAESSKVPFNKLLRNLCSNLKNNKFSKPILAILIEQSKTLIDLDDLKSIFKILNSSLDDFHSRDIQYETVTLFTVNEVFNFEITFFHDEPLCQKLALAMVLFLYASPELIMVPKRRVEEKFCRINLMLKSEAQRILPNIKIPAITSPHIQTVHLGKRDYSAPEMIIINDKFEDYADLIKMPNNKCCMYFIGATTNGIVSHFYHLKRSSKAYPKDTTRRLAYFYDYTSIEDTVTRKSNYYVNLDKLDQIET